jgi:cytosine/adenosine deaminase-related metal-dependent hydrolase
VECSETGTTLLGEIATSDWSSDQQVLAPVQCVVFRELIQRRSDELESKLAIARHHIATGQQTDRWFPGISPHAPYTTSPELVKGVARLSTETHTPVAMHLAESFEEIELLASHSGPLANFLRELGVWDPSAVPRGIEAGDYLRMLADAHRTLIVHGNYLTAGDWGFLAARRERMSVVFCPRTHARFGHSAYPLADMLQQGVHVCLGTDSRASNPDLELFREIQHVAHNHPHVSPAEALRLGTLAGAEALGFQHKLGSITAGRRADLLALPLPEHDVAEPYELLMLAEGPPRWVMRNGLMLGDE